MIDKAFIQNHSLDKIAFLAILLGSILFAKLLLHVRDQEITLSPPIQLTCAGLSISLPQGENWHHGDAWSYDLSSRSFVLMSNLMSKQTAIGTVTCSYRLLGVEKAYDIGQMLSDKIETFNIKELVSGHYSCSGSNLVFDWAYITIHKLDASIITSVCKLPDNRLFELQVMLPSANKSKTMALFYSIAESMAFTPIASDMIDLIKTSGTSSYINERQDSYFLIKNAKLQPIGFKIEIVADLPRLRASQHIQASSMVCLVGSTQFRQASVLESDDHFDRFDWKNEYRTKCVQLMTQSIFTDGLLTVKQFSNNAEDLTICLATSSIPESFLNMFFKEFMASSYDELLIDILQSDGSIAPVIVSKMPVTAQNSLIRSAIKLRLLNSGSVELVYFDDSGRVVKKMVDSEGLFWFERSTFETLTETFPDYAEEIRVRRELFSHKI